MPQIKIFKGLDSSLSELEQSINDWLDQSSAHIISIFGNIAPQTGLHASAMASQGAFAPSDVIVFVVYEP